MYWDKKEMPDRELISIDICSLYPACMMTQSYPVGKPFRALEDTLSTHFGIRPDGAYYNGMRVEGCIQARKCILLLFHFAEDDSNSEYYRSFCSARKPLSIL